MIVIFKNSETQTYQQQSHFILLDHHYWLPPLFILAYFLHTFELPQQFAGYFETNVMATATMEQMKTNKLENN